ncbi:MAG: hypothetical protein ACREEV_17465, partial [Dongiaceae bacterium]
MIAVDDHVAQVDADAEFDASALRQFRVGRQQPALNVDGELDGLHDTRKFGQDAIPGDIDDSAVERCDIGTEQIQPGRRQAVCVLFRRSHQARIPL